MASSRKLESASEKLRARTIGWEGYTRAGDITNDELARIQKLAKQPKQTSDAILANETATYIPLLLKLLAKSNRTDALQWSLVMLGDLIIGKEENQAKAVIDAGPWDALLRNLDSQDDFCSLKSATVISLLLPSDSSVPPKVSSKLARSLGKILRQSPENQDIGLQCLGEVLRSHSIRQAIWSSETSGKGKGQATEAGEGKILEGLTGLLQSIVDSSSPTSPQTQYQVALCFWLFSFERDFCENVESKFGIITLLSEIARRAVKEKVVRVILSTFRNMLTIAPEPNKPSLLTASSGMLGFTQSLISSKRFFGDDEVREDTEWLQAYLQDASRQLTTWDEYMAEVNSKHLSWTPPHTDDEFWIENARKLSESNQAALKKLLALLEQGGSPQNYSIVCSDLAKFIKYNEAGRKEIQKLGGKTRVLEILNSHPDPDVRYKALVVVQMLVSQSWLA